MRIIYNKQPIFDEDSINRILDSTADTFGRTWIQAGMQAAQKFRSREPIFFEQYFYCCDEEMYEDNHAAERWFNVGYKMIREKSVVEAGGYNWKAQYD